MSRDDQFVLIIWAKIPGQTSMSKGPRAGNEELGVIEQSGRIKSKRSGQSRAKGSRPSPEGPLGGPRGFPASGGGQWGA